MDAKKLIEHLHQMGDDAWRGWEKMCSELSLGFEAKLNSGEFNRNSLSVLENASRLYGRYQAYRDAEAKIVALMEPQEQPRDFFSGPEWDEKWDRKYIPDDAVAVGLARARSIRKAIDYLLSKEKL